MNSSPISPSRSIQHRKAYFSLSVSVLREEIQNYDTRVRRDETGTVLEVGDGIATVYGLDQAVYGELVGAGTPG